MLKFRVLVSKDHDTHGFGICSLGSSCIMETWTAAGITTELLNSHCKVSALLYDRMKD